MRRALVTAVAVVALAGADSASAAKLTGKALSASRPIAKAEVTLYRAGSKRLQAPVRLASGRTKGDGSFSLTYRAQLSGAVLYVVAGRVASMLGDARSVVVNERTTVAAGFGLAQFVKGSAISGPAPGPLNAVAMGRNLVDPRTGRIGRVLATTPNGTRTDTLRKFSSLANMLVPCVRNASRCRSLFALTGAKQKTLLQALANIAKAPVRNQQALYKLSRGGPYRPALQAAPGSWTLALRFYGDGKSLSGPGNMAIDARGNVWVTNNYEWSLDPAAPVCGSDLLMEFTPDGRYVPGSPFSGGGLNGAGYGITLDPDGHVWVGNFGFTSVDCPTASQPPHNSVSEFASNGTQISPEQTATDSGGWQDGGISWPQGTVSDVRGNIWIANCGNNTVTRYANGDHTDFLSIPLDIKKPFDIAFNGKGQAFVTGNASDSVAVIAPDGTPAGTISGGGIDKPLGIGADSKGNLWVANSELADVPCPDDSEAPPEGGSLTLINADGKLGSSTAFGGGGLNNPWGIAVDGDDNVWVSNFGGQRLSKFCGTSHKGCRTGQALSPSTGYAFDGLARNTGVAVDPSGNVWLANNWKTYPFPQKNPGGYEMVAFIGLAGPIRTPLIGPPRPL